MGWGVFGVVALLAQAVWRLTPLALQPIHEGTLGGGQSALYAAWVLFSIYAEGYRGFQKRFSPRVVARALHLARHPQPLHVALAPAFCMSLFHANARRVKIAWGVSLTIVFLVLTVRLLPQPWRGIIDGGVVIGLLWGIASILYSLARALSGGDLGVSSDVPS